MADLSETLERARMVREDAKTDAYALDGKPLSGRNIGEAFGAVLAQVTALAKCIEELTEAVRDRR